VLGLSPGLARPGPGHAFSTPSMHTPTLGTADERSRPRRPAPFPFSPFRCPEAGAWNSAACHGPAGEMISGRLEFEKHTKLSNLGDMLGASQKSKERLAAPG
jgi:hypothetical protein